MLKHVIKKTTVNVVKMRIQKNFLNLRVTDFYFTAYIILSYGQ